MAFWDGIAKQDDFGTQVLTLKSGGSSTNLGLTFPFRIGVCMHICTGRGGGMNPRLAYWSIRGCDISNTDGMQNYAGILAVDIKIGALI